MPPDARTGYMKVLARRKRPGAHGAGPALLEGEGDRAMVRAQDVGPDARRPHPRAELVGHEEVVDAPADVALAGPALHVPPGVVPGLAREEPEGVVIAARHQPAHPGALLGEKARGLLILPRASKVDLGVGGVDVTADHHALAPPPERLNQAQELVVEAQLVSKPVGTHLAVGEVDVEEMEV